MTQQVPAPYQRIVPAIWFDHDALEGTRFHVEAFRSALGDLAGDEAATGLVTVTHYPTGEDLPDFQKGFAGAPLEVRYRVCGLELSGINADDTFALSPAMSVSVALDAGLVPDAAERVTALHAALLADGGEDLMPLGEYPCSRLYVWVRDRFGMTWQVSVPSGDAVATVSEIAEAAEVAEVRPGEVPEQRRPLTIGPALLLDGSRPVEKRGEQALHRWVEVIGRLYPDEDTHLGPIARYQREGAGEADALLHGSAVLAGLPVQAMDNGGEQDFGFTCAVSLMVLAARQEQVDGLFDALPTDPGDLRLDGRRGRLLLADGADGLADRVLERDDEAAVVRHEGGAPGDGQPLQRRRPGRRRRGLRRRLPQCRAGASPPRGSSPSRRTGQRAPRGRRRRRCHRGARSSRGPGRATR